MDFGENALDGGLDMAAIHAQLRACARSDALFAGEVEQKSEQLYGDVRPIWIIRCSGSGTVGGSAASSTRRRGFSGQKIPQQLQRISTKRLCYGNKLDHIEPSLAPLI